ncbi:MAG: hypothetical protein U0234_03225 [Sandaracinus sp.]
MRTILACLVVVAAASGCATTRVPRPIGPANLATAEAPIAPNGTLVVEALEAPAPAPSGASLPVRLPSAVADAVTLAEGDVSVPAAPAAPAWDPLPSYVDQFTGSGWISRPLFTGARPPTSRARSAWAPSVSMPYGYRYSVAPPARSSSPHFSSPPAYSGF